MKDNNQASGVIGIDLGCLQDYSAVVDLRVQHALPDGTAAEPFWLIQDIFRPPLGTKYLDIVRWTKQYVAAHPPAAVAVDATGVGTAVVELFRHADLGVRIIPITITGTGEPSITPRGVHLPKQDLVACLQVAVENHRLKVRHDTPLCNVLIRELANFRAKFRPTASIEYSPWREAEHDDLVLACALGLWAGEYLRLRDSTPLRSFTVRRAAAQTLTARQFIKRLQGDRPWTLRSTSTS